MNNEYRPYTLIAELTYRCSLRCPYCSNPVGYTGHGNEIDTDTWLRVFQEAEALGVVHLNLTGGEPLLRNDLEQLIERANQLELYTNLITSGIPLTFERLSRFASLGLMACKCLFKVRGRRSQTGLREHPHFTGSSQLCSGSKRSNSR